MGDTRQNRCHRISLGRGSASRSVSARGLGPQTWAIAAAFAAGLTGSAAANPGAAAPAPPPPAPPADATAVPWPVQSNLDGLYVHLGPEAAAVRRAGVWDSVVGGELSVLRVRENELLAVIGGRLHAARWTQASGGRIGLEGVAATRLGLLVGVAAGPLLDLGDVYHPRIGASAAIWCYAGVVPYVRVGVIEASGSFVEAGLELPLPVWRHR